MSEPSLVYLIVWTGKREDALRLLEERYKGYKVVHLSARELRQSGWKGQLRSLRSLKGHALVFFFNSIEDAYEHQLLAFSELVHRCKETVIADSTGEFEIYSINSLIWRLPKLMLSGLADLFVLISVWLFLRLALILRLCRRRTKPVEGSQFDLAYLVPFPLDQLAEGGAMTHLRGFLEGMAENRATCEIFAGRKLPADGFEYHLIPSKRRFFLFRESLVLSYNFRFALEVIRLLRGRRPKAFYQRHRRFVFAGVLLSWWLDVPLILEFNGSEKWTSKYWDPARFRHWLALSEDLAVLASALVVVVSEVLRNELIECGVPENEIVVNPNAVDPNRFRPHSGSRAARRLLGIAAEAMVVCFVGSFSYWHGVEVLEEAIVTISRDATSQEGNHPEIRFLLVGDGPLRREVKQRLEDRGSAHLVTFTGMVPWEQVIDYLDVSDILVSPHVPMPDGRPFHGSPTKLFEYMAMDKPIIASDLGQISTILKHNETGWLVPPGDPSALVQAIYLLADAPALRQRLGHNARNAAQREHTWKQNSSNVLSRLDTGNAA